VQVLVRKKDVINTGAMSSRLAMSSDIPLSVSDIIQMMHGCSRNIQICCLEVDMSTGGRSPSADISTEEQHLNVPRAAVLHLLCRMINYLLWPPCIADQDIIFLPWFLLLSSSNIDTTAKQVAMVWVCAVKRRLIG